MSYKSFRKWSNRLYKTDIVLPKTVSRVTQIGPQKGKCISGSECVRRESRVRENTHKRGLCERTSRPPFFCVTADPLMDFLMGLMSRPSGCDEDIYIQ
jgi:hypothetical protein